MTNNDPPGKIRSVQRLLSPAELASRGGTVAIVDVSDAGDFQAGHIPGACNIPLFWNYRALWNSGGLDAMAANIREELLAHGIDGSKTMVFTEQNPATGFGRSCRAWFMAEHLGISAGRLCVLDGGNHQWEQAGLPVEQGDGAVRAATAGRVDSVPSQGYLLDKEETLAASARGARLIDVRDPPEFLADSAAPYAVVEGEPPVEIILAPGRIPGAIGLPWTDVFETAGERLGRFKPRAELADLFGAAGLAPSDEIVVYCFKGARSSAVLFALNLAGFGSAKTYFSGWNEWARLAELPKETGRPEPGCLAGSYAQG